MFCISMFNIMTCIYIFLLECKFKNVKKVSNENDKTTNNN